MGEQLTLPCLNKIIPGLTRYKPLTYPIQILLMCMSFIKETYVSVYVNTHTTKKVSKNTR